MLIRDPIHGDIYLNENEQKILDTKEMQRLRGIKQLGTAFLVYPGALHTRFDHSLGTSYMTKQIISSLKANGFDVDKDEEELLSISALLHDIAHIPFGHTFEDERKLFERHDAGHRTSYFLNNGELGDTLRGIGLLDKVLKILTSKNPQKNYPNPWHIQIISNTICADLLDYLRRDSYFCGLSQNYDLRILHYFTIYDGNLALNLYKHEMERLDSRSDVMNVLRMRHFLTERVYYHHVKTISGAMIAKAVEIAIDEHKLTEKDMYKLSDDGLFRLLKETPNKENPNPRIRSLIEKIEQRKLLKRAFIISTSTLPIKKQQEFTYNYHFQTGKRRETEEMIAEKVGINSEDVIIYCSGKSAFKEADVYVTSPSGIKKLSEPRREIPFDVKSIMELYENLWEFMVFAPKKYIRDVGHICEDIFNVSNEFIE